MILYKCLITGDDMFTDAFKFEEKDGFYVVKGQLVTRKAGEISDALIGGNPSAEGDDEGGVDGDNVESGVDVLLDNRLKETGFGSKKEYQTYMKEYMKTVVEKLVGSGKSEEVVKAEKNEAGQAFKTACGSKYKEWQFFAGETPDGHIALVEWADETVDGKPVSQPYVYYYKAGMVAEKC